MAGWSICGAREAERWQDETVGEAFGMVLHAGVTRRLIEYDPAYCDVILRWFEAATGTSAILQARPRMRIKT
jgi:hypothetical protein